MDIVAASEFLVNTCNVGLTALFAAETVAQHQEEVAEFADFLSNLVGNLEIMADQVDDILRVHGRVGPLSLDVALDWIHLKRCLHGSRNLFESLQQDVIAIPNVRLRIRELRKSISEVDLDFLFDSIEDLIPKKSGRGERNSAEGRATKPYVDSPLDRLHQVCASLPHLHEEMRPGNDAREPDAGVPAFASPGRGGATRGHPEGGRLGELFHSLRDFRERTESARRPLSAITKGRGEDEEEFELVSMPCPFGPPWKCYVPNRGF